MERTLIKWNLSPGTRNRVFQTHRMKDLSGMEPLVPVLLYTFLRLSSVKKDRIILTIVSMLVVFTHNFFM